jgi:hypothetical protein
MPYGSNRPRKPVLIEPPEKPMSKIVSRLKLSVAGIVLPLLFMLPASAQSWQKQGTVSVPIVALGSACNGANDTIGLTADRTQLLTCQSGAWSKQASTAAAVAVESNQCDGIYNGSQIFSICVSLASGSLYYSGHATSGIIHIGSAGWPGDWAAGTTKTHCGAFATGISIGLVCYAPTTGMSCYNSNANGMWVCGQKT